MSSLPIIVGFGGISSAGRSSSHRAFQRIIFDHLNTREQENILLELAVMTGKATYKNNSLIDQQQNAITPQKIIEKFGNQLLRDTLIRQIDGSLFDSGKIPISKRINSSSAAGTIIKLTLPKRDIPKKIPENWKIVDQDSDQQQVDIHIEGGFEFLHGDLKKSLVRTAGQLPTGYDPATLYPSKNHPRGLQMAVCGASDAIASMGISWESLLHKVAPDEIGVYAASAMGQLDDSGLGGYMKAGALGKRTSSKQMPLSLNEMPADFINAYITGSVGHVNGSVGACASFLYNLESATRDIQNKKRRIAIVGNSEAPLLPEIIEGYRAMSALAEDAQILALDKEKGISQPDHSRACRPFGYNCGFTLAESAQFVVLFDEELVLETGAQILGSVGDVFISADGFKKSISAPGIGNYVTIAKALGIARAILGEKSIREHSFINAHGTGTPQNRVTESHALNEVAKAFGIQNWPVSAVKCYLGHSIGSAAGDQLMSTLGTWAHNVIPGIFTLDRVADDVHQSNLHFSQKHIQLETGQMEAGLINAKGFGGNNATGVILSPTITEKMIQKKHGGKALNKYKSKKEGVANSIEDFNIKSQRGETAPIYKFGVNVLTGEELTITGNKIDIPGYSHSIDLDLKTPYSDMQISKEDN